MLWTRCPPLRAANVRRKNGVRLRSKVEGLLGDCVQDSVIPPRSVYHTHTRRNLHTVDKNRSELSCKHFITRTVGVTALNSVAVQIWKRLQGGAGFLSQIWNLCYPKLCENSEHRHDQSSIGWGLIKWKGDWSNVQLHPSVQSPTIELPARHRQKLYYLCRLYTIGPNGETHLT